MIDNAHTNASAHKAAFAIAESLPSAQLESLAKKLNAALLNEDGCDKFQHEVLHALDPQALPWLAQTKRTN